MNINCLTELNLVAPVLVSCCSLPVEVSPSVDGKAGVGVESTTYSCCTVRASRRIESLFPSQCVPGYRGMSTTLNERGGGGGGGGGPNNNDRPTMVTT